MVVAAKGLVKDLVKGARAAARAVARAVARQVLAAIEKLNHVMCERLKCGHLILIFLPNEMSELFPSPPSSPSDMILDHATAWAQVMRDLLIATHCHSCGASVNVCLIGYCGTHCSKMCWKANEFELMDDFECMWGDSEACGVCNCGSVSLARSARGRDPHDGWPMRCARTCVNAAIASRSPIPVTHHYDSE